MTDPQFGIMKSKSVGGNVKRLTSSLSDLTITPEIIVKFIIETMDTSGFLMDSSSTGFSLS